MLDAETGGHYHEAQVDYPCEDTEECGPVPHAPSLFWAFSVTVAPRKSEGREAIRHAMPWRGFDSPTPAIFR